MLKFQTLDSWDEQKWERAEKIYHQAFDKKGAKPEKVLRNMFLKGIGFLHLVWENQEVTAFAISARIKGKRSVLIDYLAVHPNYQNKGIGKELMDYIIDWSRREGFEKIMIEVEAEKSSENLSRIAFWKKCGFIITDYIHTYIWVPEPYQAMYLTLQPDAPIPKTGTELFTYITQIHKNSFRGV